MSVLRIRDLRVKVAGKQILNGIDLEVSSGEVHAIMGPNGSGKSTLSHALMGNPEYEVIGGSVTLDGEELLGLPTHVRAAKGLFLAPQYPAELPGVHLEPMLREALAARGPGSNSSPGLATLPARLAAEAEAVGLAPAAIGRAVNVAFSGGEKKRNETVQLAVLDPRIAIIDEIDSGLDIDALRDVARRIEQMTQETDAKPGNGGRQPLGVLAITHYARLLTELRPDRVHVLRGGLVVASGGPELADQLEQTGYEGLGISGNADEVDLR
ncbi:MAG TPA: Fe-S cluster assembly ATPase SufC [Acidimicrobiia bacterium]|nr:Fe-S cluster assembly ATPase SufC [Acidimicrobiia bacterium]